MNESFATLLAAFITLIPWLVGLYMDHKHRMEKKARQRINKSRRNPRKLEHDTSTHDEPAPSGRRSSDRDGVG